LFGKTKEKYHFKLSDTINNPLEVDNVKFHVEIQGDILKDNEKLV